MTNLIASGIIQLLIVFMTFVSVVHGAKTLNQNSGAMDRLSDRHQDTRLARRDAAIPRLPINVKPTSNNVVSPDETRGTLLKTTSLRESKRFDRKNSGQMVYRDRYAAVKSRKHKTERNEIGDSDRTIDKQYYPKGSIQQAYQAVKVPEKTDSEKPVVETPSTEVKADSDSKRSRENESLSSNTTDQMDLDNDLDFSNDSLSNETTTSSAFHGCRACQIRESDRLHRIEKLKQTILSSLHMKMPPNATRESIPRVPALTHLYQSEDDMMNDSPHSRRGDNIYDDDYIVKTERVFIKGKLPPSQDLLNVTDSLYFAPPIKLYTSKIRTAYLWFYIRKQDSRHSSVQLTIEKILPESVPAGRLITKTIFHQRLLRNRASGWKRIDIRRLLKKWLLHPMSNHGLQIRALDARGNNMVVLTPTAKVDEGYEPWLDTKILEQKSHSRHRRSQSLRCTENSNESRCCRYPLYITFAEIGWEWIIAPNQVKADYCSGECRMTMQDNTPHSWLQQQVPGPTGSCCAPTKLVAQPLMYFDDDNHTILYQILRDIKVEECGCT